MAANVAQRPDGEHIYEVQRMHRDTVQAGTRSKTRASKQGPHALGGAQGVGLREWGSRRRARPSGQAGAARTQDRAKSPTPVWGRRQGPGPATPMPGAGLLLSELCSRQSGSTAPWPLVFYMPHVALLSQVNNSAAATVAPWAGLGM